VPRVFAVALAPAVAIRAARSKPAEYAERVPARKAFAEKG